MTLLAPHSTEYMAETPTQDFATRCGLGKITSPAMLDALEAIRQSGIRAARQGHYDRKRLVDECKEHPAIFFAMVRPSLSTDEAIEDGKRFLAQYRNMPTYRRQTRFKQANEARRNIVIARFFRRFGKRAWADASPSTRRDGPVLREGV